jgi:hypothetical protein
LPTQVQKGELKGMTVWDVVHLSFSHVSISLVTDIFRVRCQCTTGRTYIDI